MIFEGDRDGLTPAERHDHRMLSIIAAGLAIIALCGAIALAWG